MTQIFTAPEHLGFKFIGIIPAAIEQLTRESLVFPAIFFGFFSLLNLYLIYLISNRITTNRTIAQYALVISAANMSLLYFARHLMPYDTAMSFGLIALYMGLTEQPNFKTSLACGGLSFLCFLIYNGYWPLAGLAMLLHVLVTSGSLVGVVRKGLITAWGFILPALLLFLAATSTGVNLLTEYRTFATTVSQGSFAEGWSLSFEYLWHTEHFLFIIMGILLLYVLIESRGRGKSIKILAGCLVFVYVCLLIPSVFLHSFVVYGRLARQMIPFLAILSASGLERLEHNHPSGQRIVRLLFLLILFQAAWNYAISYNLSFPRGFSQKVQARYPDFNFSEKRLTFGAPTLCQNNGFVMENVKHFVTFPETNPLIQGVLLLSAPHPDNFIPYQYEGYTYEERQKFRELNLQMRFYKADKAFMLETNPAWAEIKNCIVKEN